jgi:hypothetical protein
MGDIAELAADIATIDKENRRSQVNNETEHNSDRA